MHRNVNSRCTYIQLINVTIQFTYTTTHNKLINSLSSLVRKLPLAEGPSPTEVAENIE